MSMVQLIINGIALGAVYALVTLGFVFVINATGAVNFAQGELVMAGGYIAALLHSFLAVPGTLIALMVAAIMFFVGLVLALVAYFPLMRRHPATVFISTLLCSIFLQNLFVVAFGPEARGGPPLLSSGLVQLGPVEISQQAAAIVVVAAVLIGLQFVLFSRTQIGRKLRATTQDREMAQAIGIPTSRMIAITFGIGAALAGIAGALLANLYFVWPTGGVTLTVFAYMAVVIGGWGSVFGAVVGAIVIALFQVVVASFVSYTAATILLYLAVLCLFLLRPQGLFGEAIQRRA
jgi:branched-chain amino acid transport system permease protein